MPLVIGQQRAVEVEQAQLSLPASGTVKHLALTVYPPLSGFFGSALLVAHHELHQPEDADDRRPQRDRAQDAEQDRQQQGQLSSSSSAGSTRSSWRTSIASAACSRGTQRSTAASSPAVSGITAAIASWRR